MQIDRINVNGNYEPSNCQFITSAENQAIGKKQKQSNNTSSIVGVNWYKITNKWQSYISVNKKRIHLGYFFTIEEALQARIDAEIKYFGKQLTNL